MKQLSKNLIIIVIVVVAVLAYFSLFTVNQTQEAIVLRLGKITLNADGKAKIYRPGLHIRLPFVTDIKKFDMRLHTMSVNSSRIVTIEQKDVLVDAFVKWRINNIIAYYKSTGGNLARANTLLNQKVNDGLRAEFGKQTILELVSGQRANVMAVLRQNANEVAMPLGISIIDVRIKRIDLPDEVTQSVYSRMRSNREKEASLIRAQGKEGAEKIKSQADAQAAVIIATAKKNAAVIKAEGDKEAAAIYAKAYQQNPEFYAFFRSLEAYQNVFSDKHKKTLVLKPDSQFFKYFDDNNAVKQ
ncbi:MAG: protease modulator HflC [Pseudomonadota bacterium]